MDRDRERDLIFRTRERTRWLDSALREENSVSRIDPDRTDGLVGVDSKKQTPSNPISFGEELQYWTDKVQ
jgi:E3 ubiquitin-protein ligase EDD1